ncbi:hypothetical protein [Streptomyces maremycinicus]|uniref:hypothetical protein n=1 Tax=Streptomyces maremycinicus TaxID=1679753 RepID=UPI00099BE197|nr:hypothetical protein [Streptomyces sp. NBRC 110468]
MKRVALGLAAVGLMLGGAVAASHSPVEGTLPAFASTGVEFSGGKYKFNRPGVNHGAFEWRGQLKDTSSVDGHNVYAEVKVQGHDWVRYYGKQGRAVRLHESNWDGAQRYTAKAGFRVCRDRGALRPNNCAPTRIYTHDWDRG